MLFCYGTKHRKYFRDFKWSLYLKSFRDAVARKNLRDLPLRTYENLQDLTDRNKPVRIIHQRLDREMVQALSKNREHTGPAE